MPWSSARAVTEYTRPPTWDDVKRVARLLDDEGARWMLIGGYAIAAHGFVRVSEDVHILVDPSPENARRWIAALAHLPDGATRELVRREDMFEKEGPYAVRVNDEFTIDVMPAACGPRLEGARALRRAASHRWRACPGARSRRPSPDQGGHARQGPSRCGGSSQRHRGDAGGRSLRSRPADNSSRARLTRPASASVPPTGGESN
jgi:hypothetical protein